MSREPDQVIERPAPRGPKRPPGAPVGPAEVRAAVLDAAAALFGERGVSDVSLRDVAKAADVEVALIGRYIGPRTVLVDEVFRIVRDQVSDELEAKPLGQLDFGRDSHLGRWMTMLSYYNVRSIPLPSGGRDPILTLATLLEHHLGLEPQTARLRAAQITAISLGWRLFEDHLVQSANLEDLPLPLLRDDITEIQRLIGSTPWSSKPT